MADQLSDEEENPKWQKHGGIMDVDRYGKAYHACQRKAQEAA